MTYDEIAALSPLRLVQWVIQDDYDRWGHMMAATLEAIIPPTHIPEFVGAVQLAELRQGRALYEKAKAEYAAAQPSPMIELEKQRFTLLMQLAEATIETRTGVENALYALGNAINHAKLVTQLSPRQVREMALHVVCERADHAMFWVGQCTAQFRDPEQTAKARCAAALAAAHAAMMLAVEGEYQKRNSVEYIDTRRKLNYAVCAFIWARLVAIDNNVDIHTLLTKGWREAP